MSAPYRQPAPHPDAVVCHCGWRQPVRFTPHTRVTVATDGIARLDSLKVRIAFVCPDCRIEHETDEIEMVGPSGEALL